MRREHIAHFGEDSQLGQWDDGHIGQILPSGGVPTAITPGGGGGAGAGPGRNLTTERVFSTKPAVQAAVEAALKGKPSAVVGVDKNKMAVLISQSQNPERFPAVAYDPKKGELIVDPSSGLYTPSGTAPVYAGRGSSAANPVSVQHQGDSSLPLSQWEKHLLAKQKAQLQHSGVG